MSYVGPAGAATQPRHSLVCCMLAALALHLTMLTVNMLVRGLHVSGVQLASVLYADAYHPA